jgi:four helix bundle protein
MFIAYQVLLSAIQKLPPVLKAIRAKDAHMHDQLRRAAQNALANCAEARRRKGADRTNRFRICAGEADEARAFLETALAWQYADADAVAELVGLYDRALKLLWPNTQK